jgi:hypothetical protein
MLLKPHSHAQKYSNFVLHQQNAEAECILNVFSVLRSQYDDRLQKTHSLTDTCWTRRYADAVAGLEEILLMLLVYNFIILLVSE